MGPVTEGAAKGGMRQVPEQKGASEVVSGLTSPAQIKGQGGSQCANCVCLTHYAGKGISCPLGRVLTEVEAEFVAKMNPKGDCNRYKPKVST